MLVEYVKESFRVDTIDPVAEKYILTVDLKLFASNIQFK